MITPGEVKKKAERLWQRGDIGRALLGAGGDLFPLEFSCRPPTARELLADFAGVRAWIKALEAQSNETLGHGYVLTYREVAHRQLGTQRLPALVRFESVEDVARFLGKTQAAKRLRARAEQILAAEPRLSEWILDKPLRVLEYDAIWPQLLAVVAYFVAHPRPDLYLRQLDIPGVDTKIIESHEGLLAELLDVVLPPSAIDTSVTTLSGHGFERRYGLRYDEPLVRLRFLDPACAIAPGVGDLSLPLGQFRALAPRCRRVVVTENKVNGL
ncbi:MAG: DUF3322 domain-containing protein, partial [Myxococcota bacterium]